MRVNTFLLVLAAATPLAAQLEESVVWAKGEGGLATHHVLGLTVTRGGAILAFTEGRIEAGDAGPHHLLCKRSTDGGRTWSGDIFIERSTQGECWANPTALLDRTTGRVFIFYVLNEGTKDQNWTRVFYRTSGDEGRSWSERTELTDLFRENPHGWTFHMPGPGHGIQLAHQQAAMKRHNGRLLVPFWHRKAVTEIPRMYGVSMLASDDKGKTWRRAAEIGPGWGANESRLAELSDGTLIWNARGTRSRDDRLREDTSEFRILADSRDAGETVGEPRIQRDLRFGPCDAGWLALPWSRKPYTLVQSHPGTTGVRQLLTLSASQDGGRTWSRSRVVYDGGGGYSDLVALPGKTIGLLYRKGSLTERPNHVVFVRIPERWLTAGR
ncbi:MAG: exo-alpha-sialidase [Bryobacterales bacterium]|nr:exo-alpha-sialidase [Bryobacterales bacterium]